MAKHREPDFEPYLRRRRRRTVDEIKAALRTAANLPESPVPPEVREAAIAVLASDLGVPIEAMRAYLDKLADE